MMLGDYLKAPRPAWDWVNLDCSRWLDRWLMECGYPSPMAATHVEYSGPISAQRVIERGGGLFTLWAAGMEAIGLAETETPKMGDASVLSILTDDGTNQTCGIWTGERWASLHQRGLVFGVGEPLMVWSV